MTTVTYDRAGYSSPGPLQSLVGNLLSGYLAKEAKEDGVVILPFDNYADHLSLEVQVTFCAGGKLAELPYLYPFIYMFSCVCIYSGLC